MELTVDQAKWFDWLTERGGRGFLDRWGRVVAAGETSPQGATVAWLNLVAKGLLVGKDGLLFAPAPPKVYMCCPRHMGQPFSMTVSATPAFVQVCPLCEKEAPNAELTGRRPYPDGCPS